MSHVESTDNKNIYLALVPMLAAPVAALVAVLLMRNMTGVAIALVAIGLGTAALWAFTEKRLYRVLIGALVLGYLGVAVGVLALEATS